MKAIETRYKGYRFRSRLEARWAVFFDAMGIPWEYEPQGFETSKGWYLPDFLLWGELHAEVKPDGILSDHDKQRMMAFSREKGLVLLKGAPVVAVYAVVCEGQIFEINFGISIAAGGPCLVPEGEPWIKCPLETEVNWEAACSKARSARFDGRDGEFTPEPMPRPMPTRRRRVVVAELAAERDLICVMLTLRYQVGRIGERIGPEGFRDYRCREIFESLVRLGQDVPLGELRASLTPDAVVMLDAIAAEPDPLVDPAVLARDCLARLQKRALKERNAEIQRILPVATELERGRLVAEKAQNSAEIRRLSETDPAGATV